MALPIGFDRLLRHHVEDAQAAVDLVNHRPEQGEDRIARADLLDELQVGDALVYTLGFNVLDATLGHPKIVLGCHSVVCLGLSF